MEISLEKIPAKSATSYLDRSNTKRVNVFTNDHNSFLEEVVLLELWSLGDTSRQKTIEVKGGEQKFGLFNQIQFRFAEDRNYIYTRNYNNQKEFDKTYSGTASEFSISGLFVGNTNTVIRTGKTGSANDVAETYRGPADRVDVRISGLSVGAVIEDATYLPEGYPVYCVYVPTGMNQDSESKVLAKLKEWGNIMGNNLLVAPWDVGDPSYRRLVQQFVVRQVPSIILTRSNILDMNSYMVKIDDPSDVNDVEKLIKILPILVNHILGEDSLDLPGLMSEGRGQQVKSFLKPISSTLKRIKRLKISAGGFEIELA